MTWNRTEAVTVAAAPLKYPNLWSIGVTVSCTAHHESKRQWKVKVNGRWMECIFHIFHHLPGWSLWHFVVDLVESPKMPSLRLERLELTATRGPEVLVFRAASEWHKLFSHALLNLLQWLQHAATHKLRQDGSYLSIGPFGPFGPFSSRFSSICLRQFPFCTAPLLLSFQTPTNRSASGHPYVPIRTRHPEPSLRWERGR